MNPKSRILLVAAGVFGVLAIVEYRSVTKQQQEYDAVADVMNEFSSALSQASGSVYKSTKREKADKGTLFFYLGCTVACGIGTVITFSGQKSGRSFAKDRSTHDLDWRNAPTATKPCRDCGHGVTYTTNKCPSCGTFCPSVPLGVAIILVVVIISGILTIILTNLEVL